MNILNKSGQLLNKIKLFSLFSFRFKYDSALLGNFFGKEKINRNKIIKQIISIKTAIILLAFLFITALGCSIEENGTGSLSLHINIEKNGTKLTKAILPETDMTVYSYDIGLIGPNYESVTDTADSSGILTINGLKPGLWTINVTARNYDGQAIGARNETIQILPNAVVSCEITVIPYDGFGGLVLTIIWDDLSDLKSIIGTLESSADNITTIEFTLAEGMNLYENNVIPAGYYTLNIMVYDNGDFYGGAVDVVRIVAGEITEATIQIVNSSAGGDAGIVIISEMNDPIDVNLSGCVSSVNEGEFFTATAEIDDELDALCSWYIDGVQKLSGIGQNDYTISDELEVGIHRLDVTVFTLDGLRGGSASYIFGIEEPVVAAQIIADHTVVDLYADIPQYYMDIVKTWLVDIAGESHSSGYRIGINLLELQDSRFQVATFDGTIPAATSSELRLGGHGSVGEEDFYTNTAAITAIKNRITSQHNAGNPIHVLGFGWCWDMTWTNAPGGTIDPVYQVQWAGSSVDGPQGNLRWGLDSGDQVLTGNSVCMDTYLNAVTEYIEHCQTNGYVCKPIFTTGPVDGNSGSENGFQREIKHQYIRDFVLANEERILFDYADVLCWSNSGEQYVTNWNDGGTIRPHVNIHPNNMMDYDENWDLIAHTEDGDHIGEVGALRLAKAMWWMLARMAGWDGLPE